jgi:class 3 adenylate cyclase
LVAFAFVLITSVAVTYDCVVQQRTKAVLESALESRAIISSLFPEKFRDRLLVNDADVDTPQKDRTFGEAVENKAMQPAKMRLKSFIEEAPKANNADISVMQTKPIADLFPHCTVLFADIAGFTAWSSEREPAQVFTLLQTIFHYFDNIARKRAVFKVETIGDCYLAVTGLPDPQKDHAVRMTKFARECLRTVSQLTHKLESSLGPDTGDLTMRFGLHSGPVTAGVLRGEKSRFQLFGDTVGTASRMENTGRKDAIQVSQATADLLVEAGKVAWLTPRDDLVSAKGKGQIQTYWVTGASQRSQGRNSITGRTSQSMDDFSTELSMGSAEEKPESQAFSKASDSSNNNNKQQQSSSQTRKQSRLIDWQTDTLAKLLQQIIAQRDRKIASKFVADPANSIEIGECVLDEVAEIIAPPKFEDRAKYVVDARPLELSSPVVMSQLREYVAIVASKYLDNPFHNFEHASHVTMSASKLLSRIIVPEDVNYQGDNKKQIASDLHDCTYGITSDPLTQFAAIFCSLIHDVDHQGVSNFQLGAERPEMAQQYKNRSLAEQNSVDIAWDLLMQPEFRNLQQSIFAVDTELQRFRQLLVNMVLATDIFDKDFKALRESRWAKAFHNASSEKMEETFNLKSTIVIEHIIQAADVAHTMQHWHVYTKWNERLFQEMYVAFENGRQAKDPSEGWYKGELWFFDNYVIPLAKKLDECNVFGVASDEGLNYALANRAEWALKGEGIVKDMIHGYKDSKRRKGKVPRSNSIDSTMDSSVDDSVD